MGYTQLLNLGNVLLSPFEMRLRGGRSSRAPDLPFVDREHDDRLTGKRLIGPADLVVELISDSSTTRDRVEKLAEYAAEGVPEYWLIDPRPGRVQADFFRLTNQGTCATAALDADGRYHSSTLPGFWLNPAWLRQDPLPNPLLLLGTIAPNNVQINVLGSNGHPAPGAP